MYMLTISTKTGDMGESGLANGERLPKDSSIFEVLGTQDEVNSWIGLCIAKMSPALEEQKKYLLHIQDTLFYIGAELARSHKVSLKESVLTDLEKTSDELQKKMEENWTTKFLYPGGREAAATLDVTRAVSRRFERVIVTYAQKEKVSPIILKYVNRLSDYLYILRCFVNQEEKYSERSFDSSES